LTERDEIAILHRLVMDRAVGRGLRQASQSMGR
jgi:hypothetical protein